ncbi:MAG: tRNA uridine-5-carboxymethylaminomethyl(34) synthesis GTPase MnmE [Pseudomonadota bacterium]
MPNDTTHEDTIAAIATPAGRAGIGIIRISGDRAREIAGKIFQPKKPFETFISHRLYLGYLIDPASGDMVDEALLSFMKSPHSYTREDVVEINAHSGHLVLSRILQIIIDQGVRLAKPGEFTFRAFMNGRIDLTQAEAIVDLINSKSERGLHLATRQISGRFRSQIESLREKVLSLLAQIEAAIDFPEEGAGIFPRENNIARVVTELLEPIKRIIASHTQRKVWVEGLSTVIVGRVNAGKSSLLNRLLNERRAIVTSTPGTTRDIIESTIHIDGLPLKLIDTAGFRKVRGKVERIGLRLTREKLAQADLSLIVIDRGRPLNRDDMNILAKSRPESSIIALNKMDLPLGLDEEEFSRMAQGRKVVKISALTGQGIEDLRRAVLDLVLGSDRDTMSSDIIPNLRHKKAFESAFGFFKSAVQNMEENLPLEIIAMDLNSGLEALGEVIGATTNEELLDRIFSQFCLGK